MYPRPETDLSADTVVQLDDQFFTSDPFGYVRTRIATLLCDRDIDLSGPSADEFARMLGPASAGFAAVDKSTHQLQIAVDAFALRHHVAETLVRFFHVVLHHGEGASHWVELTDTPPKNFDVVKENHAVVEGADDEDGLLRSLFLAPALTTTGGQSPTSATPGPPITSASRANSGEEEDVVTNALATHIAWLNYAIALLLQHSPDLSAAHNKLKHGMGLRPQDDVLTTLISTPPSSTGELPLSALTGDGALNLFEGVTAEYLARKSKRHGLEITQLLMLPVPTLVEAAAMAHTTALLFHTAAAKHFAQREPMEGRRIPDHPGLLVGGPRPGTLRPVQPFALRFPLTTPLRTPSADAAHLYWTDGDVRTVTFGEPVSAVIVDDAPEVAHDGDGPPEVPTNSQ